MDSRFIPSGSLLAALLLTLATALGGAWLQSRLASDPGHATTGYDMNFAIELAGTAVPEELESFYFFPIDRRSPDQRQELIAVLARAAAENDYVGITGADAEHNLTVLLAALAAPDAGTLVGLTIVYVGPAAHEGRLSASIARTGADLRIVDYVPAPADAGTI